MHKSLQRRFIFALRSWSPPLRHCAVKLQRQPFKPYKDKSSNTIMAVLFLPAMRSIVFCTHGKLLFLRQLTVGTERIYQMPGHPLSITVEAAVRELTLHSRLTGESRTNAATVLADVPGHPCRNISNKIHGVEIIGLDLNTCVCQDTRGI